jgi:hypothetical protein
MAARASLASFSRLAYLLRDSSISAAMYVATSLAMGPPNPRALTASVAHAGLSMGVLMSRSALASDFFLTGSDVDLGLEGGTDLETGLFSFSGVDGGVEPSGSSFMLFIFFE